MDSLRVRPINLSFEQASSFLNQSLAEKVADGTSIVFSGTDGKREVAYVVYTRDKMKRNCIHLVSFGSDSESTGNVVCISEVIKKSKEYLFHLGIDTIYSKLYVDEYNRLNPKDIMLSTGFLPLTMHGIIAFYDIDQAIHAPAVQKIMHSRHKLPKTVSYTRDDYDVDFLFRAMRSRSVYPDPQMFCAKASRYYEKIDEGTSVIIAFTINDHLIFYPWLFTDHHTRELDQAIPLLICDSLMEAKDILPENGLISFQLFDHNQEKALTNFLGDYKKYYEIQEYICVKERGKNVL